MSYFGLISADWWLILLAHIGGAIVAGIVVLVLAAVVPDPRTWTRRLKARNERIERIREARR